tara:strand:- start:956 stop:1711 length:756 start_codon:yes stop_codon:yes gene_type:complete
VQIIPAIDLKDNKCVRLSEGKDNTSVVFNEDPEEQAKFFQKIGCKKLHIVDLDAAFGRPEINTMSIKKIRKNISIPIQLGGGIRSKLDAEKYFDLGIDNLIIGSMSVNKPDEVIFLSNKYKDKVYVSLDIKDDNVMLKGWLEKSKLQIEDVLKLYQETNIRGYVITDIKNDGMLNGINIKFLKNIIKKIEQINNHRKRIIFAGGLTNYEDLNNLKKLNNQNIEGVISGKSFYVGKIDLNKAQKILESNGQN